MEIIPLFPLRLGEELMGRGASLWYDILATYPCLSTRLGALQGQDLGLGSLSDLQHAVGPTK